MNIMSFEEIIKNLAKSDAEFDGQTWSGMGRVQRERYIERSKKSLQSVQPELIKFIIRNTILSIDSALSEYNYDPDDKFKITIEVLNKTLEEIDILINTQKENDK